MMSMTYVESTFGKPYWTLWRLKALMLSFALPLATLSPEHGMHTKDIPDLVLFAHASGLAAFPGLKVEMPGWQKRATILWTRCGNFSIYASVVVADSWANILKTLAPPTRARQHQFGKVKNSMNCFCKMGSLHLLCISASMVPPPPNLQDSLLPYSRFKAPFTLAFHASHPMASTKVHFHTNAPTIMVIKL